MSVLTLATSQPFSRSLLQILVFPRFLPGKCFSRCFLLFFPTFHWLHVFTSSSAWFFMTLVADVIKSLNFLVWFDFLFIPYSETVLERFSISNYSGQSQMTQIIQCTNQNSKQIHVAKRISASHHQFWFYFWLVEKKARAFLNSDHKVKKSHFSTPDWENIYKL